MSSACLCRTLLLFLREPPSPAHLTTRGGGGTPRTNSSLFKVLEAKAEVMPAFLDWTRDWGGEDTEGVTELIDTHGIVTKSGIHSHGLRPPAMESSHSHDEQDTVHNSRSRTSKELGHDQGNFQEGKQPHNPDSPIPHHHDSDLTMVTSHTMNQA